MIVLMLMIIIVLNLDLFQSIYGKMNFFFKMILFYGHSSDRPHAHHIELIAPVDCNQRCFRSIFVSNFHLMVTFIEVQI